ncbi:hypothetical protein [Candidatus Leptofilum sp.]|uniref:hypothetical protein n=1 Tax=Candidatus Leptofilum sp. TaxID=3241576 RepID=UPI003B590935
MEADRFNKITRQEVAKIMRDAGPKVCVFPLNGTRRWFMLERARPDQDFATAYLNGITTRLIEIIQLLFEHGVDTLLLPILSPHLFQSRGDAYTKMTVEALTLLTDHPKFLRFYDDHQVRVRFYGDYDQYFANTSFEPLVEHLQHVAERTSSHNQHRLFWGVCAHDATETTAALAIRYYQEHGRQPDKQELLEMYYGESIPPVDFFITAAKPRAFDMPLVTNGREDLYFTVAPSPYLNETQLREILYDHLYTRPKKESDYKDFEPETWQALRQFYEVNKNKTLGIGTRQNEFGVWHPVF